MKYEEVKKKSEDMLIQIMKYDLNALEDRADVNTLYIEMACTLITATVNYNPYDIKSTLLSLIEVLDEVKATCADGLLSAFKEGGEIYL